MTAAHPFLCQNLPLLAVLPGTGGLTRLTDKRRVRRDRADIFCTAEEGVRGKRAVEWRLVDEVVPPSAWEAKINERALELAARSGRTDAKGIALTRLRPHDLRNRDHLFRTSRSLWTKPRAPPPSRSAAPLTCPATCAASTTPAPAFWPLAMARELDDALLHLRLNHPSIGLIIFRSIGDRRSGRWPPTACWSNNRPTGW